MPADTTGDAEAVTITELEGLGRVLELRDTSLPEQGVSAPIELRSVVTRYPGNAKSSTQIMGTKEEDIPLTGWFRDVWTGEDGGAMAQVTLCRALVQGQRYCELAWGDSMIRRGYLRRFEPEITNRAAIRYKLVFQVSESDEASVIAVPFLPVPQPFSLLALLRAIADAAEAAAEAAILINNVARAVV